LALWIDGINDLTYKDLDNNLQQYHLHWEVQKPATSLDFLDVSLSLNLTEGKILTKSYQKPMNLHSYITPSSAHSQATFKGLIYGFVRRYWLQNSNPQDYSEMIRTFVTRLRKRNHSLYFIKNTITDAAHHFQTKMPNGKIFKNPKKKFQKTFGDQISLYYHAEYHPRGVNKSLIQRAFKATVDKLGIYNKMIVCYNRPKNIRDHLMPSKLPNVPGSNPSDLFNRTL
jgi:hypothetical protein